MFSICQRYALKANHNAQSGEATQQDDVFNMSKIRFESKSQLSVISILSAFGCFQYVKDTL